jgi:hypothetical protein
MSRRGGLDLPALLEVDEVGEFGVTPGNQVHLYSNLQLYFTELLLLQLDANLLSITQT